jgi:AraC-like DNA-binding protein
MIQHSVIGSWLTALVSGLESHGINGESFLANYGIDYPLDSNPGTRIPLDTINQLWDGAVEKTADECFGLTVGSLVTPHTLNALGMALWSVCTLREHMQCVVRYRAILSADKGAMTLEEEDGCLVSTSNVEVDENGVCRYTDYELDAICAAMVTLRRLHYKKDFCPVKMELTRSTPQNPKAFEAFFGCPVTYEQPRLRVFVSMADADAQIPGSSRNLAQATEQLALDYLTQLNQSEDIIGDVRQALLSLLPQGKATLDHVADFLHTSKRTLHRKLESHETSFRDQVEGFRKELADRYMQQDDLSLGDISFLLGFSSSSNFTRAFKRWTGVAPQEYRNCSQEHSS